MIPFLFSSDVRFFVTMQIEALLGMRTTLYGTIKHADIHIRVSLVIQCQHASQKILCS